MTDASPRKVERSARLRWIPVLGMKVNPLAQRDLNQARVDRIAAEFDPEQIGTPTVSSRDGAFFIIDGQHRIEALRQMGWNDQQVQCWVYEGLTMREEADKFLRLNDVLTVDAMARFKVGVEAGRDIECDIDRTVRSAGLCVSRDKMDGAVAAVGTLRRVYVRSGAAVLGRTLRIVRDAYGQPGLEALVIDGIGLLCQRYNGQLDEPVAVTKLANVNAGVNGLLGLAESTRRATGNQKAHCVAAAAVEIINGGKGGKKLPSWWKNDA